MKRRLWAARSMTRCPDKVVPELPGRSRPETEEFQTINPRTPRLQLLSGGEWMLAITDTGAGISCCRGLDVHMHSRDLLRRPQGIFTLVDAGEGTFSVTRAPDYREDGCLRRVEFGNGFASFFAEKGSVEAGLRMLVHPRLPCEERQLVLKNKSAHKLSAEVLFYFEPCLARREDAEAHPGFFPSVSFRSPRPGHQAAVYHPASERGRGAHVSGRRLPGRGGLCLRGEPGGAAHPGRWDWNPWRRG